VIRAGDEPFGNISYEMLCKSPAPPFGSRVHLGNRRDVLGIASNGTDGSDLSLGLVDPGETLEGKFPCFNQGSVYLEWEVYL